MAYYASSLITGSTTAVAKTTAIPLLQPYPSVMSAGEVSSVIGSISFASGTNPVANDVVELCILPAGCVVVDWYMLNDDFDTSGSPTITIKGGLISGTPGDATRDYTKVGAELWAAGTTLLQGAAFTRMNTTTAAQMVWRLAPSESDRSLGFTFDAAATTNPAAARRIDFALFYRSASYGR